MKTYAEKLRDPRWQKKRLEVMERDKFSCRYCRSDRSTLNVHHRIYRKGADPWDYEDDVFVTLCEDCHKVAENRKTSVLSSMGKYRHQDEDIELLACAIEGNPQEFTFWGWAAGQLAQCVRMHRNIMEDPSGKFRHENMEDAKSAAMEAITDIVDALKHITKSYD